MIIAFVAPKQYGKTTACNILKEYWGENVTQVNFKDALIEELIRNFPLLLREIALVYGYIKECEEITREILDLMFKEKKPLVRVLMKNYGTEVRRGDKDGYWVDKWRAGVTLTGTEHDITDDVRFKNEAEAVKHLGGYLIRLNRTDKESTDTHQSETEQKEIVCDYEITVGEGEIELLTEKLLDIVKSIEKTMV